MGKNKKNKNKMKMAAKAEKRSKPRVTDGIYTIDDSFTIPPEILAMSPEEIRAEIRKYEEQYEKEREQKQVEMQKREEGN